MRKAHFDEQGSLALEAVLSALPAFFLVALLASLFAKNLQQELADARRFFEARGRITQRGR